MKRRKKANLPAPDAPNAGFGLFIDYNMGYESSN